LELLINEFYPVCKRDYNKVMREMLMEEHRCAFQWVMYGIRKAAHNMQSKAVRRELLEVCEDVKRRRVRGLIQVMVSLEHNPPNPVSQTGMVMLVEFGAALSMMMNWGGKIPYEWYEIMSIGVSVATPFLNPK
jgi:hypothetical protein